MSTPPRILLASLPEDPVEDVRAILHAAGYCILEVSLSAESWPKLDSLGAVFVFDAGVSNLAPAFTRKLRAELGDRFIPMIWLVPSADRIALGLDAGADACLLRPLSANKLVAQLRAALRARAQTLRWETRSEDVRKNYDQLHKVFQQTATDVRIISLVNQAIQPRVLPEPEGYAFGICHRFPPGVESFGGWFQCERLSNQHVGFWLADVGNGNNVSNGLFGLTVRAAIRAWEFHNGEARLVPPEIVFSRLNEVFLQLSLDPSPLIGIVYGVLDLARNEVKLARAGAAICVRSSRTGEPELWGEPGPFLGAFEADFPSQTGCLQPGDKLVLVSAGESQLVLSAAAEHRGQPARSMAQVIAEQLAVEQPVTCFVIESLIT